MAYKETKYLVFVETASTGSTLKVDVKSKDYRTNLGQVKWFNHWRRYCFFPAENIILDSHCMLDIVEFIGSLMDARKPKTPVVVCSNPRDENPL